MEISKIVYPCYVAQWRAIKNHAVNLFIYGRELDVQNNWGKKAGCKIAHTQVGDKQVGAILSVYMYSVCIHKDTQKSHLNVDEG